MVKRRVNIRVRGRVQGVFFRASTHEKAIELGLSGWVRNNPDGSVQIVAEGDGEALNSLVRWSSSGPVHAQVTESEVNWEQYVGEFEDFTLEYI